MKSSELPQINPSPPRRHPDHILFLDDHEAVLRGCTPILKERYPGAVIFTAKDSKTAWEQLQAKMPDLLIVDLAIPEREGGRASTGIGIDFLDQVMGLLPPPNILVMTATIAALMRIRTNINLYGGGFAALDKGAPLEQMTELADIAMRGAVHLPGGLRSRRGFESIWLEVLNYRFEHGLSDRAIAKKLKVSDRTIRNYWLRIQESLRIPEDTNVDPRAKVEIEARRLGLIG